jgi:ABC-type amino acid transport substrate-binding protein
MPHDVFISHSSKDKRIADAVCAILEQDKIRCWIAPRDVQPGANWGSAIVEAIDEARIMVVIFSCNSNKSGQVLREVERGVRQGNTIIPFRVENVLPSKDIELFISCYHWLDAMSPPLEQHITKLSGVINKLLGQPAREEETNVAVRSPPSGMTRLLWYLMAMGTAAFLAAAVLFWHFLPSSTKSDNVALEEPADKATIVGPVLLRWSYNKPDESNLQFELSITQAGQAEVRTLMRRNSFHLVDAPGLIRWKVRPVWKKLNGLEQRGEWSEERLFTSYPSSLHRVLLTRTINVGTAESEGIYVRDEGGSLTGFDIELLRIIGNGILKAHRVTGGVNISSTYRVWGENLFQLLKEDQRVDLLASGISIAPEREDRYDLIFTKPLLTYPQTIVTCAQHSPFLNGKLLLTRLAAVENTTNETLGRKLLVPSDADHLRLYRGSGAYDSMFSDLLTHHVEGLLMDKPYALEKIAEFSKSQVADFFTWDVTDQIVPQLEPEKIGFALRRTDLPLLQEINAQLDLLKDQKRALINKFFPHPEGFSPD